MRISKLILKGFRLIKESDISKLDATFTESMQIILGQNGCGKSSSLRQLTTMPVTRSLYEKDGMRVLEVEKDGVTYRLESDYSKSTSPHKFFIGDDPTNVNVGGTTDVQKELIEEHLGITTIIDDLIMNRISFPKMTPAKRKEFVMGVNPDDIAFVLADHKRILSQIRSCKENISRLQARKIILEQKFITPESMEDLLQEKEVIEQTLVQYQDYLMMISSGLDKYQIFTESVNYDARKMKDDLKKLRYKMYLLSNVPRDDQERAKLLKDLIGNQGRLSERISNLSDLYQETRTHLSEMEVRYNELDISGGLDQLDSTIRSLESDRDKLETTTPPIQLTLEELDKFESQTLSIHSLLDVFSHIPHRLCTRKRRAHRESMLSIYQYRLNYVESSIGETENTLERLQKQFTTQPSDIPTNPCSKDKCPLYAMFFSEYNDNVEKISRYQSRLRKMYHRKKRLSLAVEEFSRYLKNTAPHMKNLEDLVALAQSNPVLHYVLRNMDLLHTVQTNHNVILRRVQQIYEATRKWIKWRQVCEELETACTIRNAQISSQDNDSVKLVIDMENARKSLYGLRNQIEKVSVDKVELDDLISKINLYQTIKDSVQAIRQTYEEWVYNLLGREDSKRLIFMKTMIDKDRSEKFLRLGEIERILREQDNLKSRYEEEVVAELNRIEEEKRDQEQIEKVLASIPRESTARFLNDVFERANAIISSIWVSPLQIEMVPYDEDTTYEFEVTGDFDTTRELSECSEGQTEILTLAINLAFRIVLEQTGLPICLDEAGRTFDSKHKQNLVILLKQLLDEGVVSQIFLVNHHAAIHEGFVDAENLVLKEGSLLLPNRYNEHVTIS